MEKITCKDCGYKMINYSATDFNRCPDCDSSNIHVSSLKAQKGICDLCGQEKVIVDVEINPYTIISACKLCRDKFNIEID